MTTKFHVIVADPPWAPHDRLPGPSRGAAKQYRVLSTPELCSFRLPPHAPNALLFLWRLASMPQDALDVIRAWGFAPKSEVVWHKRTKNGLVHFGMGRTVRMCHETCIVATCGRTAGLIRSNSVRSVFSAPMPVDDAGDYIHSAKPEEFFDEIVHPLIGGPLNGGPCVELFARRRRLGWVSLGDQLPLDDGVWGPP